MKKFIPMYDLSALTEQQKQDYVVALCEHLEIPPELNLVRLIWDDDGSTSRKQVAYVLKGGTDIIRANRKITTKSLTNVVLGGAVVFTCTGEDGNGRQEIAVGSKSIDGLQGKALDDSIMTAQTRSTRRMTLQFVGGGALDESEVNQATTNLNSQSTPLAELSLAPAQPTVKLNDAPGEDITDTQEAFEAAQKKLREDAIAFLNAQNSPKEGVSLQTIVSPSAETPRTSETIPGGDAAAGPEPVKKRRTRGPNKPKSALTPEDLKNQMPLPMAVSADPAVASATVIVSEIVPQLIAAPTQANPVKGLTAEQVKPYRQRLFRLNNDHFEQNGLIQKEGLGRSEQLRMLASLMFPGITNFNEMTVEQWEKYLGNLEDRVKKDGAKATVEYIQESIGI
jgi:hypothetical protein